VGWLRADHGGQVPHRAPHALPLQLRTGKYICVYVLYVLYVCMCKRLAWIDIIITVVICTLSFPLWRIITKNYRWWITPLSILFSISSLCCSAVFHLRGLVLRNPARAGQSQVRLSLALSTAELLWVVCPTSLVGRHGLHILPAHCLSFFTVLLLCGPSWDVWTSIL